MNNTTRKHPRSLVEAFGPYTDNVLHGPQRPAPWHKAETIVTLASAIAVVALIAIIAVWG